jgi:hypothetical protein
VALAVAFATPALAAEGMLVPFGADKSVIVWRSASAVTEGRALLRAKADAKTIVPLIACVPELGTPVVQAADDPGLGLRGVIITTGKWAGCRGVIIKENYKGRP